VALGDWSTWMKWRREESKKHQAKAKVDMYLVSFCLCGLCLRRSLGLLPRSELTFALSCLQVVAPSLISRAWLA